MIGSGKLALMPLVRGRLSANAPLAPLVWFRTGGAADWLFEPVDIDDLREFLTGLSASIPVMALGLGSNLIVRDGGIRAAVVRLGKHFSGAELCGEHTLRLGAGTPGIAAASAARDHGIAGLEFLRGIPGTVGGFVRMNGGAYGREVADILLECDVVHRDGSLQRLPAADLHYRYRHSELPEGAIVVSATMRGTPGDKAAIQAEMDRVAAWREEAQPLRTRTGGSTFQNPPGGKAWQEIDAAGCRGLKIGGARVSDKHANFLLNVDHATSADLESLGEEVRRRVRQHSGVDLQWEIVRVGEAK